MQDHSTSAAVIQPKKRHRERKNSEVLSMSMAHSVVEPPEVGAKRFAELANSADASREPSTTIDKEGFVPYAQLEHDGSHDKKMDGAHIAMRIGFVSVGKAAALFLCGCGLSRFQSRNGATR